jgi:hypothetical protein
VGTSASTNRHGKKDESTRKNRRSGEARTNRQCTIMHTLRVDMRLKLFCNVLCRYVVSDANINPVQGACRHSTDIWLVSCSCRRCRRRGLQQGQLTISSSAARPRDHSRERWGGASLTRNLLALSMYASINNNVVRMHAKKSRGAGAGEGVVVKGSETGSEGVVRGGLSMLPERQQQRLQLQQHGAALLFRASKPR